MAPSSFQARVEAEGFPAIRRAPFNAPANVAVVLANAGGAVGGLATDGTNVFYGTPSGLFYVSVAGATSGTLLTNKAATHLRYASGALFFLAGGVIYKIATP
jgi:putative Ca2+/H+ antiporter (TMEM165/GDT1 family)